jgi:glyoxylase-like metal-dependent hydrolase (beta-lactamase superfamily II)/8-oxo-dGTP pyrophosphatase MutT (NUDIX family)
MNPTIPTHHAHPTGPDLERDLLPNADPGFDLFAGARKAASVIVLRDAPQLQVLLMRKAERPNDANSGLVVFPGGVLDAKDRQAHGHVRGLDDASASQQFHLSQGGLDYLVAAARECFEEVGLLLASDSQGQRLSGELPPSALEARRQLLDGSADMHGVLSELGLHLQADDWAYVSHWLTPPGVTKRYDTRFFLVRAPEGQVPQADLGEAAELMWLSPAEALEKDRALKLLPVTRRLLEELRAHPDTEAALAQARRTPAHQVRLTMPRLAAHPKRGVRIVHPSEHAWAELALLDPRGAATASADIVPGRPVRLFPEVIRVTAPNPGMMTGPGTNSYLVGCPQRNRWTVIDPGPADAGQDAHLDAILAAAPGPIERIVVTHTHRDHSPAARALAARTGAPVMGQAAPPHPGQDPDFQPDHRLKDGDWLPLSSTDDPQETGLGLRVLHTPGHASNHLCFELPHRHLLFTGDHLMQGSTVVINPPDGDMAAYLESLRQLRERPLHWLAPGHGFVVAQPRVAIDQLIAHRLAREAKVFAALDAELLSLDVLVTKAYGDVSTQLHGLAQRSLLAHLIKLARDGRAQADGDELTDSTLRWRRA